MEQTRGITCIQTAITTKKLPGRYMNNKSTWEFPPVENVDSIGNKSIWTITAFAYDTTEQKKIPIDTLWITHPILNPPPPNIVGITVISIKKHTGHIQVGEETVVAQGKNIGKLNATTSISQAIREAHRKYINKHRISNKPTDIYNITRPLPMLLKKSGSTKSATLTDADFVEGIVVQPKLDGIRTISHMLNDKSVEFYSRKGLAFNGLDHIMSEVYDILSQQKKFNLTDIYLDGEIYIYDVPLQDLSGAIRGENNQLKEKLEFHIFDCFILDHIEMIQADRYKILKSLFIQKYKYIKLVPTITVTDMEKVTQCYDNFIKMGYEGAIARKLTGMYKFGVGSQRSSDVTKIKPFTTEEFKIINYTDGRGKDKNAVKFILETENGDEFAAVPNMTIERRRELFSKFTTQSKYYDTHYKDKMATIQYAIKSKKGIPTQPKFIAVRDYE